MSDFTFEVTEKSLFMSVSDRVMDVSDDIYVKANKIPKPLWDRALRYDGKLKALMKQMKRYSA